MEWSSCKESMSLFTFLSLLLVVSQGSTAGATTACSASSRTSDLASCLNDIRQVAESDENFWFGSVARAKCAAPHLAYTLDCFNPYPTALSLSQLAFGVNGTDLSTIDRYVDVDFTSGPGSYTGCDYEFSTNITKEFSLDPLSSVAHVPWDLRSRPNVSWTAPNSSDLYTLVVKDVGNGFNHGIFMNIPGGDLSQAEIKKDYHGPRNYRKSVPNVYGFILYKQSGTINSSSITVPLMGLNLTSLAETHSLQGPVGLTWLLASSDAYALELQSQAGIINNCVSVVAEAYTKHKSRPFLPASLSSLTVQLRVHMNTTDITYQCGDQSKTEKGSSYWVDPIGMPVVSTASARTGATITYKMKMNKLFPNNAADFAGKKYSILTVDPDIPAGSSAGTNELPLLHGMITNIQGDDVTSGHIVHSYLGPKPPDSKVHVYYFLLYEQQNVINVTDTSKYAGSCGGSLAGRCLFNVTKFTSSMDMTLVGATWLTANTDQYVTCSNMTPTGTAEKLSLSLSSLVLTIFNTLFMMVVFGHRFTR